jgi:hypothetical protein
MNKLALVFVCFLFSVQAYALQDESATEKQKLIKLVDWVKYADLAQIEPEFFYAVALKESGKIYNKSFIPSPYAIGIGVDKSIGQMKHVSLYPKDKTEAEEVLSQLIASGYKNLGIGMMQISWLYHSDKVNNALELLDININMDVAGQILKACKKRNKTNLRTLSCYSYGEGDDPNGLIYAHKASDYANTYGQTFMNQLIPKGPPVGELNVSFLAAIWQQIEAESVPPNRNKGAL